MDYCLLKNDYEAFLDVASFARRFVDRAIVGAVRDIAEITGKLLPVENFPLRFKVEGDLCTAENGWPCCGSMNARKGLERIEMMMNEWNSQPGMQMWMFLVEFMSMTSDRRSDFYFYQVKWSVPTPAYPEPRVTVCVYITVEASLVKHASCPVDVTYVFEGTRFIHRPDIAFQPKWLYDVLDMKTMMFNTFKF